MNPHILKGLLAFNTTTNIFFYIYANGNNELHHQQMELHSATRDYLTSMSDILKKVVEIK